MRLRGSKTELEEMGEDVSDMATTTSQLQAKLLSLTGGKVDIMLDENTFKSSTQILREMADAWENMNDIQRASALELMGGKRQANVLSALIQNFDTAEKAIEASAKSAGSALRENEVYLDSIQGRIDLFNNSVQTMWSNALDDDTVKWFINAATEIVKAINAVVDSIGLLNTAIVAFAGSKLLAWILKAATGMGTFGQALQYIGMMLTSTSGTGAAFTTTIVAQTKALWGASVAGNVFTKSIKTAGIALKAFFSTPLGWLTAIAMAIMLTVHLVDVFTTSTDELTEELDGLKSNLQDIQSELDTVNSELETTQERMAELIALPSLSFTEQEELDRLREQNEELERREHLLEAQAEREKKRIAEKAKETIDSQLSDKSYNGDFWDSAFAGLDGALTGAAAGAVFGSIIPGIGTLVGSIIGGVGGLIGGVGAEHLSNRISTEDKLNEEIEGYESLITKRSELEEKLSTASTDGTGLFGWGKSEYDKTKEKLEEVKKEIVETETYIDQTLSELGTTLDGVEYGYDADEALDKYYNDLYKWEIAHGTIGAASNGLEHIFSRPEHEVAKEGIDQYVQLLKEGDESAKVEIEKIIKNNDALIADIEAMGLEIQDAVDYFTMKGIGFDNTPEGIISQYQTAKQILEDLKNQKINLDDLVEYDAESNKATAKVDKIAEHLKGVGPDIQKEFANIIEDVKEGTLDYEKAFDKLDIYSMQSMVAYAKTQLESANKIAFPDLEISGWLDSVNELQGAFDSLATSMDLVTKAHKEMSGHGRISLKTALDLMASTDEWNKILDVNNGVITMNANAEQILIQSKLDLIKANIEMALQQVETDIAIMEGAINSTEAGNTLVDGLGGAINHVQAALVGLKAGWDAFWAGENVFAAIKGGYNKTIDKLTPDESSLADLKQQKAELEKKLEMLGTVDTTKEFKDNYDFDDEDPIKTGWEKLIAKYENELALITNERDLIEAEIDKIEAHGGKASSQYYKDLIRNSSEEKDLLIQKKAAMEEYLEQYGDSIDPDTWTEYNNEINETAVAIKECTTNLLEFYDALEELTIHYFEKATDEVSKLGEEIEFVQSLLEDEDVADENGNWTAAGYTMLGLYTNEMERAAAMAAMYKEEIDKVGGSWSDYQELLANAEDISGDGVIDAADLSEEALNGLYDTYGYVITSEEEYKEKTDELTDSMHSEINAFNDAKDGIVELNEARIDAIKEGIEKEIEAYEDYIDAVKDALDAERDLYDFKKKVKDQTKDISQLERRIASLSGATDAASVAERRKLEAQLLEAKEGLNDTYYEHSVDQQQQALDDEAEAFSESKEKYIEELEKTLDDVETLITNSIMDVMLNADTVLAQLNDISEKYGIDLSPKLTKPWVDAAAKPTEYWQNAKDAMSGYTDFLTGAELEKNFEKTITGFGAQIQTIIDQWNGVKQAADDAYAAQTRKVTVGGTGNTGSNDTGKTGAPEKEVEKDTRPVMTKSGSAGSSDYIQSATSYIEAKDGKKYYPIKGRTGWYVKEGSFYSKTGWINEGSYTYKIQQYSKGTIGTSRDEWALTDELGDELVLVPGANGNLSFMRKGTSVVPADITANLVEWGKLNPDMLKVGGGANINMISNAVTKPEFNFDVENFLKVERVDKDTLPELEKMMDKKIDNLVRQLNYSIKKFK